MKKQFILLQVLLSVCLAGQYLVVSHQTLYDNDWYQPLADLKGQFGYTVDHLEITDGMNLNQIISAVVNHTPRADVLLLVGDACRYPVEQKQVVSATNGNFIPFGYEEMTVDFILSGTRLFDVASDKLLKDTFENQHGVRPIVGRVPAETVTEIVNWVHKLEAYHHYTTHPTDHEKILLVTDNKDHPSNGGTEWFANKDRDSILVRLAPSDHQVLQLNSGDYAGTYYENIASRAADFETAVNDGVGLIYTHGSAASAQWLSNFYWANADTNASQPDWAFTNTDRYPFLLGMSCSIGKIYGSDSNQGYVEIPSVVEKLMFLEDAGIIGAVAPTEDTFSFTLKVIYKALWPRFVSGDYDNYYSLVQDALDDMLAAFATDWVWWEGRKTWLSSLGTREWEYRSYVFYGDPTMPISTAQYKEDDITQNTTWQGTVVVKSNITVNAGATLTIKPGTAVLFDGYRSLTVEDGARLIADGTEDYPILFSSLNGNTPQSWNKLYLRASDNLLRWCEIEYGNWAVHAYGSPATDNHFEYCTFRNNDQGLRVENN
ncbi:MAG: hypothetical protein K9N22_10490, partial [Candidatus Marinimicrobia bacterium]|nr:hypothetical protein [Candidatus Neomarinimicrobiota bacterium]